MEKYETNKEAHAALLKEIGISELARRLDISRQIIHKWNGHIPIQHVIKIEGVTGIPRELISPEHFRGKPPKEAK